MLCNGSGTNKNDAYITVALMKSELPDMSEEMAREACYSVETHHAGVEPMTRLIPRC